MQWSLNVLNIPQHLIHLPCLPYSKLDSGDYVWLLFAEFDQEGPETERFVNEWRQRAYYGQTICCQNDYPETLKPLGMRIARERPNSSTPAHLHDLAAASTFVSSQDVE